MRDARLIETAYPRCVAGSRRTHRFFNRPSCLGTIRCRPVEPLVRRSSNVRTETIIPGIRGHTALITQLPGHADEDPTDRVPASAPRFIRQPRRSPSPVRADADSGAARSLPRSAETEVQGGRPSVHPDRIARYASPTRAVLRRRDTPLGEPVHEQVPGLRTNQNPPVRHGRGIELS